MPACVPRLNVIDLKHAKQISLALLVTMRAKALSLHAQILIQDSIDCPNMSQTYEELPLNSFLN